MDEMRPNRIQELREAQALERYDLAAELRVSVDTIARWEKGKTGVPDRYKLALAKRFGVKVTYLMRWPERAAA